MSAAVRRGIAVMPCPLYSILTLPPSLRHTRSLADFYEQQLDFPTAIFFHEKCLDIATMTRCAASVLRCAVCARDA